MVDARRNTIDSWNHDTIYNTLVEIAAANEMKNGKVMWPLRVALTGKPITPGGAIDIADILGQEESLKRIESAVNQLEGKNG